MSGYKVGWKLTAHELNNIKSICKTYLYIKGRIHEYIVIAEDDENYLCLSEYTRMTFVAKKTKTFKSRDAIKYNNFKIKMNEKQRKARVKALISTKQYEYKKRYINENPEKLI